MCDKLLRSVCQNRTWDGSTDSDRERRRSTSSNSREGNHSALSVTSRQKSRSVSNLMEQSMLRPSVFDRLYASRPNRRVKSSEPRESDKVRTNTVSFRVVSSVAVSKRTIRDSRIKLIDRFASTIRSKFSHPIAERRCGNNHIRWGGNPDKYNL